MADLHDHDSHQENAPNANTHDSYVHDNGMQNGIHDPPRCAEEDPDDDDDDDFVVTRGYDTRRSSGRQTVQERITEEAGAETNQGDDEDGEAPLDEESELVRTPVDQIQLQILVEQTTETRVDDDPASPCGSAVANSEEASPGGNLCNRSTSEGTEGGTLSASRSPVPLTQVKNPEDPSPKDSNKHTAAIVKLA
ncbi:hypothetical protein C8Q78DRAFT_1078801 [Trametes maxima]|nr:hypothetical protein C8Q78DRAFT_1078801 [Trametes maxima]